MGTEWASAESKNLRRVLALIFLVGIGCFISFPAGGGGTIWGYIAGAANLGMAIFGFLALKADSEKLLWLLILVGLGGIGFNIFTLVMTAIDLDACLDCSTGRCQPGLTRYSDDWCYENFIFPCLSMAICAILSIPVFLLTPKIRVNGWLPGDGY
mmetsp:Transcript_1136/g.3499  ORF Transcript_1136/g.3499 Transcript_1136/m.3499 type:complete len:155 (-) Transcript_1136:1427-1891(-)